MAVNRKFVEMNNMLPLGPTLPQQAAGTGDGVPVLWDSIIPGVLVGNVDANQNGIVQSDGIWELTVYDTVGGGINAGDKLTIATATNHIENTAAGAGHVFYGYATSYPSAASGSNNPVANPVVGAGLNAVICVRIGKV